MAKWMRFHLNGGKAGNTQLVDPRTLQETYDRLTPFSRAGLYKPDFPSSYILTDYGMGWISGVYDGGYTIFHDGSTLTHTSHLAMMPHYRLGVFQSAIGGRNQADVELAEDLIFFYAVDLLLGNEPWLNISSGTNDLVSTKPALTTTTHSMQFPLRFHPLFE